MAQRIHEKIRDPEGQSVFVRADENVPFGAFATVMDAVKQSGITNVSIVTQPLEKQWQPTLTSLPTEGSVRGPLIGSVALHVALFALALFGYLIPSRRGESWGGTTGGGGAMSATLVSSIPLPGRRPQTQNVLANESKGLTQSQAEGEPKEEPKAIPIPERETPRRRTDADRRRRSRRRRKSRRSGRQQDSVRGRWPGQRPVRFVYLRRTRKAA